jgi:hypothetical protein
MLGYFEAKGYANEAQPNLQMCILLNPHLLLRHVKSTKSSRPRCKPTKIFRSGLESTIIFDMYLNTYDLKLILI